MDLAAVLDTLGTVTGGLSDEEAASRLAHYGPNTLPRLDFGDRVLEGLAVRDGGIAFRVKHRGPR